MSDQENELWQGLAPDAQVALVTRDYRVHTFSSQVGESGIEAGRLASADRARPEVSEAWIPGVEIFARTVHPQRHRGAFGEFARRDEGLLSEIGLWPQQWAAARMFGQTAKGFHVHPPSIPKDTQPAEWLRWLFVEEPNNYALRRYEQEQWDVMFFVQGVAEMILRDVRAGFPKRTMRLLIDGDRAPHFVRNLKAGSPVMWKRLRYQNRGGSFWEVASDKQQTDFFSSLVSRRFFG